MAAVPDIVTEIQKKFDEAKSHHDRFCQLYERRERAYRGVLRAPQDAAKWKHQYHPPYAFNLIETIVSSTVEMGLRLNVRPSPKANLTYEEATAMLDQVDSVRDLLHHEHRVDEMDYKQRPLYLTAAIGGRGIGKSYWNYTEGVVRRQGVTEVPVYDEHENVVMTVPTVTEITEKGLLRDHSTTEIVDPRDFILHESAKALQPWDVGGAQHLFHRCWYSIEQLRMWEAAGFVKNVDKLSETRDQSGEYRDREQEVWNITRTKDLVEVIEYWCFKNGQVYRTLVGNRTILLRDEEPTPFWHGGYPFFICASMPQPFSTIGMSDIELIEELQNILWELQNQTLDNIELINNFITLIDMDNVEDPDAFEAYPGARWPTRPEFVQPLQPPYQLANVTAQREALIKGDLQNVTSATPLAGGADSGNIDQKTATGVSLVMNAAQQRLSAKKFQAQQAIRQEAQMRLKNCQQFITDQRLVHIIGPSGRMAFRSISPLDIQGEFVVELDPVGENINKQERRANADLVLQRMQGMFPQSYAAGTPIDLKAVTKWWAREWDIEDEVAAFFQHDQQPDPNTVNVLFGNAPKVQIRGMMSPEASDQAAQEAGVTPQGGQAPGGTNMGTTSSTAVDASKPSATGGLSMSPAMMIQRVLAARGGANNAPRR